VNVTAGHQSTIAGRSAPSIPRPADALAITAWARDLAWAHTLASAHPKDDLKPLDFIRDYRPQPKPLDLDSLNYEQWRDEHRDWFAREFPWIFKAQKALKDHYSINADYIELLMVSGDIWQFNYPRALDQPIPMFNAVAIKQLAAHYSADPARLLKAIGTNSPIREKQADHSEGESLAESLAASDDKYRSTLQRWHSDIVSFGHTTGGNQTVPTPTGNTDVLLFTLRAGIYLKNTRIAAWLWARSHSDQMVAVSILRNKSGIALADSKSWTYQQWSNHLQEEAVAADSASHIVPELIVAPKFTGCERTAGPLIAQLIDSTERLLEMAVSR